MSWNYHECDMMPKDIQIFIDSTGRLGDVRTQLNTRILADNGATSHCATLYQIKYCPYCGERLTSGVK